jgi:uncharacterized protein (DUF1778 family)
MAPETQPGSPPKSAPRSRKTRRIAIRLTDELAEQLRRAVILSGRSQTDFITEAIATKASETEREQYLLELSDRDMDALLDAIARPPAPNAAMLRAAARWQERGSPM